MTGTLTVQFLDGAPEKTRYAGASSKQYEYLYAGDISQVEVDDLAVVYVDYSGLEGYKVVRIVAKTDIRTNRASKYVIGVVSEKGMKELVERIRRREQLMEVIEEKAKLKERMSKLRSLAEGDAELQELFKALDGL